MHVAAEHLVLLVAEHLRRGGIDDGDLAVEVDAEDAVADGLEDGVRLAGEGAEAAFGADLLADVDAEAKDVRRAAGNVDELVAIGDDADLAVCVREMEQALRLAGLGDLVEIRRDSAPAFSGDELGEIVARHLLDRAADASRRRGC